jgi:hypothetical protein
MKQIERIYANDFGMAFYWVKDESVLTDKIQLVFKETGFYFSPFEMQVFVDCIEDSRQRNACCKDCEVKQQCSKFLLKTPCRQIDLAVSMKELKSLDDLVKGALFRIELERFVNGCGRN